MANDELLGRVSWDGIAAAKDEDMGISLGDVWIDFGKMSQSSIKRMSVPVCSSLVLGRRSPESTFPDLVSLFFIPETCKHQKTRKVVKSDYKTPGMFTLVESFIGRSDSQKKTLKVTQLRGTATMTDVWVAFSAQASGAGGHWWLKSLT